MTLNGHFALKSVSGSATNGLASPAFGQNCSKKCSPGNAVSGSIRLIQIFAGVRWIWCVKWERGSWKWRFLIHSFTVFRTFYIHGHAAAFRWYDCQWPWAYLKVIGLFHIKFLKTVCDTAKSYYRLLIGNRTLVFDWCHVWWPWSTFEGHFSLGCHFHVHFSNPSHAFASHGLPAIAELLVVGSFIVNGICSIKTLFCVFVRESLSLRETCLCIFQVTWFYSIFFCFFFNVVFVFYL